MSLLKLNLASALLAANEPIVRKRQATLAHKQAMDAEVQKLISAAKETGAQMDQIDACKILGLNYHVEEATNHDKFMAKWGHLDQTRIFHMDAIRETCVNYDLKFLPTSLYRGALDAGIPAAIEALRTSNKGKLPTTKGDFDADWRRKEVTEFFIAAPKQAFALQERPKDPLLFCKLDENLFYLVHKWGDDLSRLRRARIFLRDYINLMLFSAGIGAFICAMLWGTAASCGAHVPLWGKLAMFVVPTIGVAVIAHLAGGQTPRDLRSRRFMDNFRD